jgi:hypothetical protein
MPRLKFPTTCIILLTVLSFSLFAQQWRFFGLKDHQVSGIVIQNGMMAVGTDSGLIAKANDIQWNQVPLDSSKNMPVLDMKQSGRTQVVIAAGNDTEEDAVFYGAQIWGPPYYQTKLIDRFPKVQSVAPTFGISSGDTVYAGGGNSVTMCFRADSLSPYGKLQPVKIPPNSFGVEMPVCAALQCWYFNNQPFAGGYDRSVNPGPGHILYMRNDSMTVIKKLDITAIAQGELGDVIVHNVFFATKDSGFYYTHAGLSEPPRHYMETPNKEPVNDFFIINGTIAKPARWFVAVKNGVYTNGSGVRWIEIGNIPAVPFCLAYMTKSDNYNDSLLFAGTNDGIYVLDLPVATGQPVTLQKQNLLKVHKGPSGSYSVTFFLNNANTVHIDLFDCKGRRIKKVVHGYMPGGKHTIQLHRTNSLYRMANNSICFLRMKTNGRECVRRFLFAGD